MSGAIRIVVAEDEPAVRSVVKRLLVAEGFTVLEAADGAEALETIGNFNGEVHLLISDVVMPRLNGIELVEHLAIRYPHVPVVLISGFGTHELEQRGIPAPCGLLRKPFQPESLLAEVRRCLAQAA